MEGDAATTFKGLLVRSLARFDTLPRVLALADLVFKSRPEVRGELRRQLDVVPGKKLGLAYGRRFIAERLRDGGSDGSRTLRYLELARIALCADKKELESLWTRFELKGFDACEFVRVTLGRLGRDLDAHLPERLRPTTTVMTVMDPSTFPPMIFFGVTKEEQATLHVSYRPGERHFYCNRELLDPEIGRALSLCLRSSGCERRSRSEPVRRSIEEAVVETDQTREPMLQDKDDGNAEAASLPDDKCGVCGESFPSRTLLSAHLNARHREKNGGRFPCDACGLGFRRMQALVRHTRGVHSAVRDRRCPHCEFRSASQNLRRHLQQMHPDRQQQQQKQQDSQSLQQQSGASSRNECKICGRVFRHRYSLDRHVKKTHLGLEELQCLRCAFRTAHKQSLARHVSSWHEKAAGGGYVVGHTAAVGGARCPHCHASFAYHYQVQKHVDNRHWIEAASGQTTVAQCSICGSVFPSRVALSVHVDRVHVGAITHPHLPCGQCGLLLPDPERLRDHVAVSHDDVKQAVTSRVILIRPERTEPEELQLLDPLSEQACQAFVATSDYLNVR